MNKIYLVIVSDVNDYSISWTGNYPGFSCKCYGAFSTENKASEVAERLENSEIYGIPIDTIDSDGESIFSRATFIQGVFDSNDDDY